MINQITIISSDGTEKQYFVSDTCSGRVIRKYLKGVKQEDFGGTRDTKAQTLFNNHQKVLGSGLNLVQLESGKKYLLSAGRLADLITYISTVGQEEFDTWGPNELNLFDKFTQVAKDGS